MIVVRHHKKHNLSENEVSLRKQLQETLAYSLLGGNCVCGEDIWVLDAAFTGYSCFSRIKEETCADGDFEIRQNKKYGNRPKQKR